MKKNTRRKYLIPAVACLVVMAGIVYYYFFASMAAGNETRYVYIDTDDTVDSGLHQACRRIKFKWYGRIQDARTT